jgi:mono/diheme cytochrome c family protein
MIKVVFLFGMLSWISVCYYENSELKKNPKLESGYIKLTYFYSIIDSGSALYQKHCLSCHQKDGSGVPNMFPPLKNSDWVKGDPSRLIKNVLFGLKGEIEVNNEIYSQVMPKLDYLSDKQIAEVLNYVRNNFGNKAKHIKPEDVRMIRKQANK